MESEIERVVLAGGCFWGMQDLFRKKPGIIKTCVGYAGGNTSNATYVEVKQGHTGHAESVEILFNPKLTDLREILEFFFQIHDPTTLNKQGNDHGSQYRSAIFYDNPIQLPIIKDVIADVDASGIWPGKVLTEVKPAEIFWEAEDEHQDYLLNNPGGYTCHFARPNWRLPKRYD